MLGRLGEFDAFIHVCIYGPALRCGVGAASNFTTSEFAGNKFTGGRSLLLVPGCDMAATKATGRSTSSFVVDQKYGTLIEVFYGARRS